jgi:hypothetical protein
MVHGLAVVITPNGNTPFECVTGRLKLILFTPMQSFASIASGLLPIYPDQRRFSKPSGSYRREVAPTASGQCDLRTVFPKVISGLRRPIAIQAAISLNMNLPE